MGKGNTIHCMHWQLSTKLRKFQFIFFLKEKGLPDHETVLESIEETTQKRCCFHCCFSWERHLRLHEQRNTTHCQSIYSYCSVNLKRISQQTGGIFESNKYEQYKKLIFIDISYFSTEKYINFFSSTTREHFVTIAKLTH